MNHRLFSNLIHMLRSAVSIPAVGSSKTLKGAQHKLTGKSQRRLFPNENWTSKDNWMARINYQSIVTDWWLCHGDSLDTELNATMCTETHQKRTWNVSSCYPSDWFHQFSQSYGIHHKYNFEKKKISFKRTLLMTLPAIDWTLFSTHHHISFSRFTAFKFSWYQPFVAVWNRRIQDQRSLANRLNSWLMDKIGNKSFVVSVTNHWLETLQVRYFQWIKLLSSQFSVSFRRLRPVSIDVFKHSNVELNRFVSNQQILTSYFGKLIFFSTTILAKSQHVATAENRPPHWKLFHYFFLKERQCHSTIKD